MGPITTSDVPSPAEAVHASASAALLATVPLPSLFEILRDATLAGEAEHVR